MITIQKSEAMKRIWKEFREINRFPDVNIGLSIGLPDQDNIFRWSASLTGPRDSSYKGGIFDLRVEFPDNYPESAPEIYFITPIFHLYVNPYNNKDWGIKLGHVSLTILDNWKPEYTIREIFTYIFALLYNPNPNFAYGFERVNEFKFNRKLYEEKVKYFTKKYANAFTFCKKHDKWDFSYE